MHSASPTSDRDGASVEASLLTVAIREVTRQSRGITTSAADDALTYICWLCVDRRSDDQFPCLSIGSLVPPSFLLFYDFLCSVESVDWQIGE